MIISTVFSNYILLGCKEIGRLSIFLIIAYLFFGLLRSEKDLRIYLAALFCTGLVYILNVTYGFIQNGFNIFIPNLEELVKPKGDYLNLNSIGSFFIIIISLLLALFLSDKNKKRRSYLLIFISIYVFALIITNSRAAILSTVISSLFIIYFKNKKIFIRIISVILILIPVLLLSPLNNYIDLYFRVERLTSGRNWIWETVFNVIKDHPILGVGPAATKYEMYKELPFMLGSHAEKFILFHYHEIEFGHAHNFYLFFLSDLGILGLATSLFLPFVFIKMGFQNMKKFKDKFPENYWLSLGITAAGIGLFIRGIFEWGNLISYGTLGIDLPFWLIFMILIFLYQKKITVTRNVSKI
jgi:O-antigen ligase